MARDFAAYWEREEPPVPAAKKPLPKKLFSLSAVPATVPRAQKYQSSLDDWKPWAPIRFTLEAPQYYQYEVKAAKDGKSADILARGDLNGDGKTSLFRQHLEVDPATHALRIAPKIEETDPLE